MNIPASMDTRQTLVRAEGYSAYVPTEGLGPFFALTHDEQVELARTFNEIDERYDDIEASEDTGSTTDILLNSMAVELDMQDQAIDALMVEREELKALLADKREEISALVDTANGLYGQVREARDEAGSTTDLLVAASRYVGNCRELLGKVGIEIMTEAATGLPFLEADTDALLNFVIDSSQ